MLRSPRLTNEHRPAVHKPGGKADTSANIRHAARIAKLPIVAYRIARAREIMVLPQAFNAVIRMGEIGALTWTQEWTYQDLAAAVLAYIAWNPEATIEPEGWIRHRPSNRRRVCIFENDEPLGEMEWIQP